MRLNLASANGYVCVRGCRQCLTWFATFSLSLLVLVVGDRLRLWFFFFSVLFVCLSCVDRSSAHGHRRDHSRHSPKNDIRFFFSLFFFFGIYFLFTRARAQALAIATIVVVFVIFTVDAVNSTTVKCNQCMNKKWISIVLFYFFSVARLINRILFCDMKMIVDTLSSFIFQIFLFYIFGVCRYAHSVFHAD